MWARWLPIVVIAVMTGIGGGVVAQQLGEEEKFALRGRVVNVVTGEPVSGALVEVYSVARSAQFSLADGTFEFRDLPRGTYIVNARKPGYFNDRDLGMQKPGTEPSLAVPSEEEAVLKLTPEGIISGRVEDEKGRPLEGVNVQPERWMVANGTKQLQHWPEGSIQTDDEGNFRIAELPPGDYYLKFSEPGGGGMVFRDTPTRSRVRKAGEASEGKSGFGAQYYPGVVDEAMASAIHLRAGVEVPIRQVLEPLRLYEVSGVVRGAPKGEGFSVMLMTGGAAVEARGKSQVSPSTGEFRIEGVPPGRYLLTATAQDATAERFSRRPSQLVAQTVIEVTADMPGLVLLLGHGATIGVRMVEVSTKGGEYGHQARLMLQSTEFPQASQQLLVPPPVNEPRAPRAFENVAAGTYSVEAYPEGWGYVASIRCAGVDLLKEDLKVGAGTSVAPIEVTLRNDGAVLNLSAVENGKPVAARVMVYSEEYPKRSTAMMTWPTNVTPVRNLAPGTYKLIATRGSGEVEFRNPAVMAKYLAHATTVTLAPESNVNVQVEVDEEPEQ
jgi:hypothetical protein